MESTVPNLVSAQWLQANIDNVKLLYTRLADVKTGVVEATENKVIPGALLFDFENEFAASDSESIRVCRRLIILRELANEQTSNLFPRSTRACSSHGFDIRARTFIEVGCDGVYFI